MPANHIIVIGASSGGVEALRRLTHDLPSDLPANDGTVGLWEIKRHGGITVVQDPAEALYPSMPLSAIENVSIDHRVSVGQMGSLLELLATGEKENAMQTPTGAARPELSHADRPFSGLTCPECRGPLWEESHGKLKQYQCRVGHEYSFESLVEQQAITTERALWMVVLAVEEGVILEREAARRASNEEAQQACEREARRKEEQVLLLRDLLTQPDPVFVQPLRRS